MGFGVVGFRVWALRKVSQGCIWGLVTCGNFSLRSSFMRSLLSSHVYLVAMYMNLNPGTLQRDPRAGTAEGLGAVSGLGLHATPGANHT